MFPKITTIIAFLAAAQALAVPAASGSLKPLQDEAAELAAEGLVLLKTQTLGDSGIITIYGSIAVTSDESTDSNTTTTPVPLVKRCGSNQPLCGTAWVPAVSPCETLVGTVQGNPSFLLGNPRSVCYESWGNKCCISWSANVGTIRQSDLHAAARGGLDHCVFNGRSCRTTDVSLNDQCVSQCLSNRATGCA